MFRMVVLSGLLIVQVATAQDGIRSGTIKSLDADKGIVTITADGKDLAFKVGDRTRIMDAGGQPVQQRLKDMAFKPGTPVMFKAGPGDVLIGLKLGGMGRGGKGAPPPKVDTSKLIPLMDLGTREYQGFKGGLYPDGKNERPAAHEAAGLKLAGQVQPLDAGGKPAKDGKIGLLAIGMSNTQQSFAGFMQAARTAGGINPRVVLVNGAQGGMTAFAIQDPDDKRTGTRYWDTVDDRLKAAGVTRAQVQAVWIKQADAGPNQGFPKYAQTLQAELTKIVQVLAKRFPNLKLVYLSSRTYGGWAKTRLNPEPYAYESGFAVKWLIEQQLKGDAALNFDSSKGKITAPWLSWGPYLWANGTSKRSDGFSYEEADFRDNDRTHQSPSGQKKVGNLLLQFFKTDTTTKGWFVGK